MRVLFISTNEWVPWGGSEELWSQAAMRLAATGHEVTASVPYWPTLSDKVIHLGAKGVRIHRRPAVTLVARVRRKIFRNEDLNWLKRQSPDLVVFSLGYSLEGLSWMLACQKANLPYVTILQSNWEGWWPIDDLADALAKAYSGARKIYPVSQRNLELLRVQCVEPLPNAEVVWNPINLSSNRLVPWPPEEGTWKLACVARLEPFSKGQDLLFQVLARPEWQDRPLEVNLYGSGKSERRLRKLANVLELKQVFFRGHVADVSDIWVKNHLLILPSRLEGLPLTLVEAMCCGRPGIVTDVGDSARMCPDGETGFVAAAPTIGFLADAMERAWEARSGWQALGLAARKRYETVVPTDPVGQLCDKLLQIR